MQEMNHPDGTISREFFTEAELRRGKMQARRRELEAQGFTFGRVAYLMKKTKYEPHQGKKEIARRLARMQRAEEVTA